MILQPNLGRFSRVDNIAAPRYNTSDGGDTANCVSQEPKMIRLIKRYGSRKLYDTEESRYVALDELAGWIRDGQQIKVIDNKTADDVTAQTLTQIISEEGRTDMTFSCPIDQVKRA